MALPGSYSRLLMDRGTCRQLWSAACKACGQPAGQLVKSSSDGYSSPQVVTRRLLHVRRTQKQQQHQQQTASSCPHHQIPPPESSNENWTSSGHVTTTCPHPDQTSSTTTSTTPTKTLHDLPGPPAWPILGNFVTYIKKENRGRLHEALAEQHQRYGKIFKEKLGPNTQLHVADPDLFEEIYRNEGQYPERPPMQSWRLYRRVTGRPEGILTADGANWRRMRRLVDKPVLPPKAAAEHATALYDIVHEMVGRLEQLRDQHGTLELTHTLPHLLYKWALESVSQVTLGQRMGCLQPTVPDRAQLFIDSALKMMSSSLYVMVGEKIHYKLNTRWWKAHQDAWDHIMRISEEYISERVVQEVEQREAGESPTQDVLTYLLSRDMSEDEVVSNVAEMLLSGIDTTSNSLCFTLYLLSKHPEVQQRLYDEVTSCLNGRSSAYQDLNKMTYLKCVLRESHRLFPVATMNARVLENDLPVGGYTIPKKTLCVLNHYAVCRDPDVFDRPDEFLPERWMKDSDHKYHPFAHLPFGFGPKGCVGKRIAMLELELSVSQITKRYQLIPHEGVTFKPILRTLLTTGETVPVKFVNR